MDKIKSEAKSELKTWLDSFVEEQSRYVRRAFFIKPYIKGLGEVPVNLLAVAGIAVAGLANPGFWLLGASAELAYLFLMSQDERFRKWVRAMDEAATGGDAGARKEAMLSGLSDKRQMRYRDLEGRCAQVLDSARRSGGTTGLEQPMVDSLNRLLWVYLKMLVSSQVLETHLRQTSSEVLEHEIETLERQLEEAQQDPARERIAKSLAGTLDIARKRRENLSKAYEDAQFIQAELLRIEQQVNLMIQEATLSRDAGFLTGRVDEVMQSFTQTQDWMKANSEILGSVQTELDAPPPIFGVEA